MKTGETIPDGFRDGFGCFIGGIKLLLLDHPSSIDAGVDPAPATRDESPGAILGRHPPFLLWPAARREFYQTIAYTALLPLAWGMVVFGRCAIAVVACYAAGALVAYALLQWLFRRNLGKAALTFHHTLACALIAAALAYPLMPWYVALGAGAGVTLLMAATGSIGRPWLHVGLLAALLLVVLYPTPRRWPLLARNHLVLGNAAHNRSGSIYRWPRSGGPGGVDAVRFERPGLVLQSLYATIAANPLSGPSRLRLQRAFALDLPAPGDLFLGAVPGRIGTVGLLAIVLAGLWLSCRHILLPGAWALFLLGVVVGLVLGPFSSHVFDHEFWQSLGGLWYLPPERALTLVVDELCSADFLFASVFVLALPGTMPMEPMARRVFLLAAGILAALAHRLAVPALPATLTLLLLQPLTPTLDVLFHRRSWVRP